MHPFSDSSFGPRQASGVSSGWVPAIEVVKIPRFFSAELGKNMVVEVHLPLGYRQDKSRQYPLLLANDGQDMKAVRLAETLADLQHQGRIEPLIVATVYADSERRQLYGTAYHADYKQRGAKAADYTRFILQELMPYLLNHYRISPRRDGLGFMGFSLGGLSALDIVWNHAPFFRFAGVFSGSFWWRAKGYDEGYTDADRLMHKQIREGQHQPGLRFWFQCGTADETNDRDKDGVIDSIGDTLHLMQELRDKGYGPEDMRYLEIEGGEHNQATWAEALPDFLVWAYGTGK